MRCSGKLESKSLKATPPFLLVLLQSNLQKSRRPRVPRCSSLAGCGQRITAGNVLQSSSKLHRVYRLAMVHVVSIQ